MSNFLDDATVLNSLDLISSDSNQCVIYKFVEKKFLFDYFIAKN
jgi:hypothetical protein